MKVVIADKMDSQAEVILKKMGLEVDIRPANGEIELEQVISDADGLLIRSATTVTPELLDKASNLKAVGRAGIGVDNVDIKKATENKVLVMNTPLANAVSTAEHTIALLFAVSRQVAQANSSMHAGKWEKSIFKGTELFNKTLGMIGCGNIGQIVANRAQGIKMKVKVYDPFLTDEKAQQIDVEKVSLDELIKTADFITLHTPMTEQTRNIIDSKEFSQMKKGVYIVNAARGGLINEKALKVALDDNIVAGAALDVYEVEPVTSHILQNNSKVILTPHIAASTIEAQANVAIQIAEQMGDYLLNNKITNAINNK